MVTLIFLYFFVLMKIILVVAFKTLKSEFEYGKKLHWNTIQTSFFGEQKIIVMLDLHLKNNLITDK